MKYAFALLVGLAALSAFAGRWEVMVDGCAARTAEARCSAVPFNRRWPGHQRSKDQTEICNFARFDLAAPVKVEITAPRDFSSVIVKPASKWVVPKVEGRRISFVLPSCGAYSVEIDGFHECLFLFADPPKDYGVSEDGPNVIYFGPGEHDAGVITMKSGDTLYLHEDAVVYGRVEAIDADNIRILGRGILDASKVEEKVIRNDPEKDREELEKGFAVCNVDRYDTINLNFCDHIEIDGITIRDSQIYSIRPTACRDLVIRNVKVIGNWRYNSDGFDMHNCRDVIIADSFLRTYDDSICVKGYDYRMDEADMLHDGEMFDIFDNVLVTNCVIWCDWGRALEIGAETRAKEIKNIRFTDCDIIRATHIALDVQNVDYADVHDITFENIRVEIDDHTPCPVMQVTDDQRYVDDPANGYMPTLFCSVVTYIPEYSKGDVKRGRNHDILVKDISVTAPSMPGISLIGYDGDHRVSGVAFDGIRLNGSAVSREQAPVSVNAFADSPVWR